MSFPTPHCPQRVAITAQGVVSPLGAGLGATLASLQQGRDCVAPVTAFDVSRCRSKTAGHAPELPASGDGRHRDKLHPASRMMIAAARETMLGDPDFRPELMIIGTTSGGMSYGQAFHRGQI